MLTVIGVMVSTSNLNKRGCGVINYSLGNCGAE